MTFLNFNKNRMSIENRLDFLFEKVKSYLIPDTDMIFTRYENVKDYTNYLEQLLIKIKTGDIEALYKLKLEFAPTGNLQELSISNGWGKAFLKIAEEFDDVIEDLNL